MAKKEMSFEEAMNRLEQIVSCLEENKESLDKTIELFEEGLTLVNKCDNKLKEFEEKINSIQKRSEENETV